MPSSRLLVQASHPVFRLLVLTTPTRGFPCLPEGSRCQHKTQGSGRPPSRVGVKPFFRRASHLCVCRMQTHAVWPSHHRQMWLLEQHWTWLNGALIHRPWPSVVFLRGGATPPRKNTTEGYPCRCQ